ncbi:MAG: HlyD family efflux transporter periplasmic adaptor subunit [Pseudomonadota bacterium]
MLKPVEDKTVTTVDDELSTERTAPAPKRSVVVSTARALIQLVLMVGVLAGAYTVMERMIAAQPERGARPSFNRSIPVDSLAATLSEHRPTLNLFGEVVAGRTIDIRPASAGKVISVHPDLAVGNRIEVGETLFSIDPFDLEVAVAEARADLAQTNASIVEIRARIASETIQMEIAREQFAFAQSDLERAQVLRDNGTLNAKQVEDRALILSQRRQAVAQRENNIAIEEARLVQQEAAADRLALNLRRAERNLADGSVAAPFTGVVRTASVEAGRQVTAGDVVVSMYDDRALEVRFTLTDAQYGRIAVDGDPLIGREIGVGWRVGGQTYAYTAQVTRLGADVASERGGIDVYARIADPDANEVQIRPGAFVSLQVPDRHYEASVRLPERAIYDGPSVFLINDGELRREMITLHAFDGSEAIVGGLDAGATVLTTRLSNADDGVAVRTGDEPQRPRGERGESGDRGEGAGAEGGGEAQQRRGNGARDGAGPRAGSGNGN